MDQLRGEIPRSSIGAREVVFGFNWYVGLMPHGVDGRRSASPQLAVEAPPAQQNALPVAFPSSVRHVSCAPPIRAAEDWLLWGRVLPPPELQCAAPLSTVAIGGYSRNMCELRN